MSSNTITLKDFHDRHLKLGDKDLILDVRNRDEYSEGHINGSRNIPLPELSQHIDELKQFEHIYIHCKRGGRAKSAFDTLSSAGLTNLVCVHDAGMDAWIEQGYAVKKP